jgi:hypothetical protein
MVKKIVLTLVVLSGAIAVPRPAVAGCTTELADCYLRAARVDSFWYRWATGLDCEIDYTGCVRTRLLGV